MGRILISHASKEEGVGSCSDSWCPPPCNGFIMRHLRSFQAHDPDTRSSKEEEEEEEKLFLNFSRSSPSPSSFFIRPFGGREKTHGSKDLRILSFAETSVFVELFFGTRSLVRVHFFGDRTGV